MSLDTEDLKNDNSLNNNGKKEIYAMSFGDIISDGRTKTTTKIIKLFRLGIDLIFLLLLGFGILFFYLNSKMAGYVLIFLAIIRYFTKNE